MRHASLIKPRVLTPLAQKVLQCRISLRETQEEFANRFRINRITLNRWENGRTHNIAKIHREILEALRERLKNEGKLLPTDILTTISRQIDEGRVVNAS